MQNLNKFYPILVILISGYFVLLGLTGKLALLINSDYFIFNFAMSLLLFIFGILALIKKIKIPGTGMIILIFFTILILVLPIKPLSATTANNRNLNIANLGSGNTELIPLLQKETKSLQLQDWVKLKLQEPDLNKFVGQEALISGFVFQPQQTEVFSIDNFYIGRFIITCCAVDAAPLGLEVSKYSETGADMASNFKIDDWVEVLGVWKVESRDNKNYLVLIPKEIKSIPIPDNPYIQ